MVNLNVRLSKLKYSCKSCVHFVILLLLKSYLLILSLYFSQFLSYCVLLSSACDDVNKEGKNLRRQWAIGTCCLTSACVLLNELSDLLFRTLTKTEMVESQGRCIFFFKHLSLWLFFQYKRYWYFALNP